LEREKFVDVPQRIGVPLLKMIRTSRLERAFWRGRLRRKNPPELSHGRDWLTT
jgi:hypothetical protein